MTREYDMGNPCCGAIGHCPCEADRLIAALRARIAEQAAQLAASPRWVMWPDAPAGTLCTLVWPAGDSIRFSFLRPDGSVSSGSKLLRMEKGDLWLEIPEQTGLAAADPQDRRPAGNPELASLRVRASRQDAILSQVKALEAKWTEECAGSDCKPRWDGYIVIEELRAALETGNACNT